MNRTVKNVLAGLTLMLTAASAWAQADSYPRDYSLNSLDPRVAELLVWDLCAKYGQKASQCKVQMAQGRTLVAVAPDDVHSRIVRMLVERDAAVTESLGFEIVLVRASSGPEGKSVAEANIKQALDAVRELFPYTSFEIVDRGLIRTAAEGSTRLGSPAAGMYQVRLRHRDTVTRMDSRELTVDLTLLRPLPEGGVTETLSSVLTLKEGETIVAGSSRLAADGGTLLVLLTSRREGGR